MIEVENWTRKQWEEEKKQSDKVLFYLYTPICGTCQVASKMMNVIDVLKADMPIGKADLNYLKDVAVDFKIESVPCLLIAENGEVKEKIYAFQSIPYLLEKIG